MGLGTTALDRAVIVFFLTVITRMEIYEALSKLNKDKSPGPDKIHPRVIIEISKELLEPFDIIFNNSIKNQQILDNWKKAAKIETSTICKLMESITINKMMTCKTTTFLPTKFEFLP